MSQEPRFRFALLRRLITVVRICLLNRWNEVKVYRRRLWGKLFEILSRVRKPRPSFQPLGSAPEPHISGEAHFASPVDRESPFKLIFSESLDALHNTTLDLTPYASEERFRFIDCEAFVKKRVLEIYETSILPSDRDFYAVISYVWFGLPSSPSVLQEDGSFHVYCGVRSDGSVREDGGPISIKVLTFACLWSSQAGASYLWLDRLCILQSSKRDKAWQISRMYDVYTQCRECVVLPGGLQRLASVYDKTTWADRAWTYQEVIATWDYAILLTKDWHRPQGEQHWLVEGECHWQYLHQLFLEGDNLLVSPPERLFEASSDVQGPDTGSPKPCLIFGDNGAALNILRRMMEYKAYNHLVEEGEETINEDTIRQLVLQGVAMRISSRPVDMVFSILGLMGVQKSFHERTDDFAENERFRATLALVEVALRQESDNDEANSNTLLDVPLWVSLIHFDKPHGDSLEQRNAAVSSWPHITSLPTLQELAEVLDEEAPSQTAQAQRKLKRVPLSKWSFEVTQTEEEPQKRAAAIVETVSESDLMKAYHGEAGRVIFQHDDEGIIELCKTLEIKTGIKDENEQLESLPDTSVFGWSLRLKDHPYIRFYKFDVSRFLQ